MLELQSTYLGQPESVLNHLILQNLTIIIYSSADALVLLDALSLRLIRVLAFSDAFPGSNTGNKIKCISVDSGMKLIVASMNNRIAVWSLSSLDSTWRIHSSLVLPDDHAVTTLDCNAGLLAVGSLRGLSVYTLILENDLPTWSQKWMHTVITPSLARFCPSMMYIATTSIDDNTVRIFSTTTGRLTQNIPHLRPVNNLTWRHSEAASRDDLVLYTITSDAVLRIFMPVLDSLQFLQLHGAIDVPFTPRSSLSKGKEKASPSPSSIFWLDRKIITDALHAILKGSSSHTSGSDAYGEEESKRRRAREVLEEGWDLFLRVEGDGSVLVVAVANIDGRPPRFLKQFTLQHTLPHTLPSAPSHLYLLSHPASHTLTLTTSAPLRSHHLSPLHFLFSPPSLSSPSSMLPMRAQNKTGLGVEGGTIVRFVRTPEGGGVGVLREGGRGEVWGVGSGGLERRGAWSGDGDFVVVLDGGKSVATYSANTHLLTLRSFRAANQPTTLVLPILASLFSLPTSGTHESIIGITPTFSIVHVIFTPSSAGGMITQHSHHHLPPGPAGKIKKILPVDPMAWSRTRGDQGEWSAHDVLLSVSEEGELAFWVLEEDLGRADNGAGSVDGNEWRCTGKVRTGRKGFSRARCSSAKKSALVVPGPEGEELTIWDSTESEFASGMEYRTVFSAREPIHDLDWTSTPDNQSILAVGFPHHVELLCQQRMTYFDEEPGWAMCYRIQISDMVPYPISDSIWLANGSLLVGAGHQMLMFGPPSKKIPEHARVDSLFEYAARHNGPLQDYHPQMLLQCLLWEKVETVKEIIVNLARDIEQTRASEKTERAWSTIPVEQFLRKDGTIKSKSAQSKQRYNFLFSAPEEKEESDEDGFSRAFVMKLIEQLEMEPLPHLTPNEHAHLLVLIQTTLEIDEQRRALDANGLRYVISMRSFYILNRRVKSDPSSPQTNGNIPRQSGYRERLRYRDMVWAFHSESQELLLNTSTAACNGKMGWSDARALGIFVWLNSVESMKSHMEVIARNEYMAGDNRDPTACSLFYFALGKVKLVHGLWRQAAWHKEQSVMLKFLNNDFNEPRWRTAALKNAYALLSKRRFEYAAAFFLLGNSLKDAVNVCIKQLSDFQLAVALARIVEQGDDGPILSGILKNTVLPTAFKDGNRWLGSWAFWMMRRRDLAVRILLTPLRDIASSMDILVVDIGEPHYDDPSLALLFSQLKSKTLQAAKGTSEISGRAEFNFVLQMTRVFCRMGCHVLALDLVRSWSFERPSTIARDLPEASNASSAYQTGPPSPISSRRSMFPLEPALRRRSSIMIDMEISSEPPTRRASPERTAPKGIAEETIKEEGDLLARKAGMGNLMKSAKQDVKVQEFDMDAFF